MKTGFIKLQFSQPNKDVHGKLYSLSQLFKTSSCNQIGKIKRREFLGIHQPEYERLHLNLKFMWNSSTM